jgi:hypothetical protein
MLAQADRLIQRRADTQGQRQARHADRQFRRRWGAAPAADPRALVIDEAVPRAGRDGASDAIVARIRGLRSLGYAVSFVAAQFHEGDDEGLAALEEADVDCWRRPHYGSVEEVLCRQAGCFDAVYLHRPTTVAKYHALARHHCPGARILSGAAQGAAFPPAPAAGG